MTPDPGRAADRALDDMREHLIETLQTLIRFETVSVDLSTGSDRAFTQEAELQEWVGRRLRSAGCRVDQWEPDPSALREHPMIPPWHHWRDRPITVGTLPGVGGGRSLIVNGHIDVVDPGDPARWTTAPFGGELRDGRIYGRGSADMKGGIAAALVALEALVDAGVRLLGDVVFEVVSDEEIGGMGTIAAAERGYRADAAVCPEPTGFDVWVVTRGVIHARLDVRGRAAHAEINQPPWQRGGGVNANHKLLRIADSLLELGERWRADRSSRHAVLGPPTLELTMLRGGEFIANLPERCELAVNATYPPTKADADGYGSASRAELQEAVARVCADDDWLTHCPPAWTWLLDYPPCEIDAGSPIVATASNVARAIRRDGAVSGTDSGYDGALLTQLYGIPSPAFGPGDLTAAHATDESIAVDDLIDGARAYARLLIDWCGTE